MPRRSSGPLLLDTHVWIWLFEGDRARLSKRVVSLAERAAAAGELLVSAISVWELGMLVAKGRLSLSRDLPGWVAETRRPPGVQVIPVTVTIALEAGALPGVMHGDPADRIIAATARVTGGTLLTCDERLLAYGGAGRLRVRDAGR